VAVVKAMGVDVIVTVGVAVTVVWETTMVN
jgi:hypothetical protein